MKEKFPALRNGLSYLDNAATTQKPEIVIKQIKKFYNESNANPHRGVYKLSTKATQELETSRKTIADFINSNENEIFFVKNATEGLNNLANSLEKTLTPKDNVVTTILEHHSNFVPWLELTKRTNTELRIAKNFPLEQEIISLIDKNTKIVTITMMSNLSGLIINAKKLIKEIKQKNSSCIIILDAAQAVAHQEINVKELDCDYLVFSGHKIYGPLGVGAVYGKYEQLEKLTPSIFGGGMIQDYKEEFIYLDVPRRFEAGTLDVASISGLREAIKFFLNTENKFEKEKKLQNFLVKELKKINGIKIIGHETENYGPVVSFTLKGIHPHDVASIADSFNVCIRAGHHCAKPYLKHIGIDVVSRASISFYNDEEDIMKLLDSIKKAKVIFNE